MLRYLNPHEFTRKEHAAITIMASAAAVSALATEALAAQELFYGGYPSKAAGIFIVLSSQLLGFGVAGLLREVIVHPVKMLWPMTLPVTTLLETIHREKHVTKQRMRVWYIVFFSFFVWTIFPEYVFVVLTGVSIVCLADQNNLVITNLFGGASGNEGLGMLSLCFDWNYIASFNSPLWYPLQTTFNMFLGIIGCYSLFMGEFVVACKFFIHCTFSSHRSQAFTTEMCGSPRSSLSSLNHCLMHLQPPRTIPSMIRPSS